MNTPTWYRVQGDVNDTLDARLDGVADLAGVNAISASVWRTTAPVVNVPLSAAVIDPTERTVRVSLASWLATAAPGVWNVEVVATWGTGEVRTWPARGTGRIEVRADA